MFLFGFSGSLFTTITLICIAWVYVFMNFSAKPEDKINEYSEKHFSIYQASSLPVSYIEDSGIQLNDYQSSAQVIETYFKPKVPEITYKNNSFGKEPPPIPGYAYIRHGRAPPVV